VAVTAIVFSPDRSWPLPEAVEGWLQGLPVGRVDAGSADDVMAMALRARPYAVVVDARGAGRDAGLELVRRLKTDSYTGVIPTVVVAPAGLDALAESYRAGADEVVPADTPTAEARIRLEVLLHRSHRDLSVHPSTRLPGAVEIEADIARRLANGALFATCYADLDHFKEFNDRYSYYDGDGVIRMLSRILHDVVKGVSGEVGFVGHIGGDDFIFIIPIPAIHDVCSEIINVFDLLIPLQYSEADRRAGYFFGKDRRGQLHRVPLMTVSIGVVTNERRSFTHAAQVSALATEMKSYAKTLSGSIYSIDRRTDTPSESLTAIPAGSDVFSHREEP
jgi:GGDEF domain-containing protein